MGAWGPGLFSDDTACDIRDEYRDALAGGADDAEAEAVVLSEFAEELADPEERAVVWLALAVTESKLGRLSESTRRAALEVLDDGADLDRWREAGAGDLRRRSVALDKVRSQIEGPQPYPRKIRHRRVPTSSLNVGDVLAYRASSGRVYLMRVAGLIDVGSGHSLQVAIRFLDYAGAEMPESDGLAAIPDRKRRPPWKKTELRVIDDSSEQRDRVRVSVVGFKPDAGGVQTTDPKSAATWADVTRYFETRDQLALESAPSDMSGT